MKTYKDIAKRQSELPDKHIENNILRSIEAEIYVSASTGGFFILTMNFDNFYSLSMINSEMLFADILGAIAECLELPKEGISKISDIRNIPVRIICDHRFQNVIGVGHSTKDEFLLEEDITEMSKENVGEEIKKIYEGMIKCTTTYSP